jgi:Phage integrase central domain
LAVRRAERAKAAAAPETLTFAKAQAYFDQHEAKWTNAKHRDAFLATLRQYAFPRIGALDVAEITTPHVLQVLEQKIPASKGNPAGVAWQVRTTTASRVRNRIELVLDWAAVRGYRPQGVPNAANFTTRAARARADRQDHASPCRAVRRNTGAHERAAPARRVRRQGADVRNPDGGTRG